MSSISGNEWFGIKINKNKKEVELNLHKGFIYVQAIDKKKCRMKMIINIDPHMDYIP